MPDGMQLMTGSRFMKKYIFTYIFIYMGDNIYQTMKIY